MAKKIINARMKQRRDTKANWAAANPVLLAGELGIVSDDNNFKIGDGVTPWNVLPFPFQGALTSVIYAELVTLRNTGKLTPGMLYRITDYITATKQENTQSAGHPFDVIVLALSESELSEQAWAVQSARDTDGYFANSKLSAWKIWYCLDNNTSRFAWADATNGKGVIYRMIDEHNNDCPYDFKNIQFVRYELNAPDEYVASDIYDRWVEQLSKNIRTMFDNDMRSYRWAGLNGNRYWEEEYSAAYSSQTGVTKAFYTFSTYNYEDASMLGYCHDNKMSHSGQLPNNVFFGPDCYNNSFGTGCYNNSFGTGCYNNSFGTGCYNNSFGTGCYNNSFGTECYNNSFGSDCYNNSFGSGIFYNSFAYNCRYNSFGTECYNNSFGNNFENNSFDSDCYGNSSSDYFTSNSLGSYCINSLFVDYCRYNVVDNGVTVTLDNEQTASYNQQVQNYHFTKGLRSQTIAVERNRAYETTVAIDSSGNVKQFCVADIIL